jgi:hypothetical protein
MLSVIVLWMYTLVSADVIEPSKIRLKRRQKDRTMD